MELGDHFGPRPLVSAEKLEAFEAYRQSGEQLLLF
jgi:hypothetical protein